MMLLLAIALVAQDAPSGVARIRSDARALAPMVSTDLSRAFLKAADSLPTVTPRKLHYDTATRAFLTEQQASGREDRKGLREVPVDETFFDNTRYGSPLAYARPMEILGNDMDDSEAARKKGVTVGWATRRPWRRASSRPIRSYGGYDGV